MDVGKDDCASTSSSIARAVCDTVSKFSVSITTMSCAAQQLIPYRSSRILLQTPINVTQQQQAAIEMRTIAQTGSGTSCD